MAAPSQCTTPWTAIAMTAMVRLEAAAGKPSKSKKPYKKSGGIKGMAFMQSMFKAYLKNQKKAGKSKKCKKCDYNSSDSSDSE
jgi:hypothetical protein